MVWNICHGRFKMFTSTKLTLKMLPKTFSTLPKWWIFVKSGHTEPIPISQRGFFKMPIQKRIFATLWALLDLSNIEMMTPISQSNRDGHYYMNLELFGYICLRMKWAKLLWGYICRLRVSFVHWGLIYFKMIGFHWTPLNGILHSLIRCSCSKKWSENRARFWMSGIWTAEIG